MTSGPGLNRPNSVKRLGVFGGTFDPIHYGHLVAAEQLREAFGLDRVVFIPANRSPNKPGYRPASARHRLRMVELAIRGCRRFAVSDVEVRRGGTSYTIDTVRHLGRRLGEGVELWLLLGMDAYLEVPTWKDFRAVLGRCFIGVACRPGYRAAAMPKIVSDNARFAETTAVDISSSDLRARVRRGLSIRYLAPPSVEAYVRRHGLYRGAERPEVPAARRAKRSRLGSAAGPRCRRQRPGAGTRPHRRVQPAGGSKRG